MKIEFDSIDNRKVYWHTSAHILAQAVCRLFEGTKLAIGPAIESGFYYDFDTKVPLTHDDLPKIEAEMNKIINENLEIEHFNLSFKESTKIMKEQPYKLELIDELHGKNKQISFYKQGEFVDLCAGPHLNSTGLVKAFKLTNCTGAYWKGNSKNKMLQRIYGVSFPGEEQLKAHLEAIEEAKKRDHNKIGRELEYFTTVDYIGQGLPILMPKGTKVIQTLQRFIEDEEEKRGYMLTKTPLLAKSDLYKISGHWDHYRESMFIIGDENSDEDVLALRPMTCPFQFQVYLNKSRSYRDLPMRLNETSTLFRNESSGEMHGLIRVRQFTISEGHIACTPEQLDEEFAQCLDLANFVLDALGIRDDVTYRFSKWDENNKEKYIGNADEWENVQNVMRKILKTSNLDFVEADGEAAFYGPKLDVQFKNVHGKEDTLITIQIDFQLAKRFGMEYVDKNGQKVNPYVIHRTSLGCYERTLALLLEKYAGALPVWLMPEQVRILPISENFHEYAQKIQDRIKKFGVNLVTIDLENEKIGYKIRKAQVEKIPYMIIVGEKEMNENVISVRERKAGNLGIMNIDEFISKLTEKIRLKK